MDNYEYCTQWIASAWPEKDVRVLDYGCGAGTTVRRLLAAGFDAYGCEVFYAGGDLSAQVEGDLLGSRILRMEDARVPFADATFDVVVNNMVIEHVEDLALAVAEMTRVLKPGGTILSLFPDRGAWREGHCGIPFLHMFPKRSTPRIYYAALLRALGLGYFKGTKPVMQWSRDFCDWLDRWTHYRPIGTIVDEFARRTGVVTQHGDDWLRRRLGRGAALVRWMPAAFQRWLAAKIGCRVLVARRAA